MMSSEEETDCFSSAKQEKLLLKKNRRTRQRVDAGEPRNSYASIPNFSSRPPCAAPYLSSPPPSFNAAAVATTSLLSSQQQQQHVATNISNLVSGSSPSSNNGWLLASSPQLDRQSPMIIESGPNNNNSNIVGNYSGDTLATKGGAASGELRHLLPLMSYRHQRSPLRALQRSPHHHHQQHHQSQGVATTQSRSQQFRRRSHSLDNNNGGGRDSDSDSGGHQPHHRRDHSASVVVDIECSVLNGNNNNNNNSLNTSSGGGVFRDSEIMAPQQHGLHHPSQRTTRGSAAGRGSSSSASSTTSSNEGDAGNAVNATSASSSSSSQLLREILQGGASAAKISAATATSLDSSAAMTNGSGSCSSNSSGENGVAKSNGNNGSLISRLLAKNNNNNLAQTHISGRTRNNTSKNKSAKSGNNAPATIAAPPPDNKEEDEEAQESEGEGQFDEASAHAITSAANEVADGTLVHDTQQKQQQQRACSVSDDEVDPPDDQEEVETAMGGEENLAEEELDEEEMIIGVEPEGTGSSRRRRRNIVNRRQFRAKMNGERAPPALSPPSAPATPEQHEINAVDFSATAAANRRHRLIIDEKNDDDDEATNTADDDEEAPIQTSTHESSTIATAACSSSSGSITAPPPQQQPSHAPPQLQSTPTDAELKRARVENIISTMRSSPSRPAPGDGPAVNGCKKRKRYMPQQHEARITPTTTANASSTDGGADRLSPPTYDDDMEEDEFMALGAPAGKMRRTHQQVVLRHQLNLMQAQIAAIKQKLDNTYGQPESSDSEEAPASGYNSADDTQQLSNNGFGDEEEGGCVGGVGADSGNRPTPPPRPVSRDERADSPADNDDDLLASSPVPPVFHRYRFPTPSSVIEERIASAQNRESSLRGEQHQQQQQQQQQQPSMMSKSPRTPDLEPAHFIDEARRLVYEQERVTKEADINRKMAPLPSSVAAAMSSSSPAEPKVAATAAAAAAAVAAASGPVPRPSFAVVPPDWESLAHTLKTGMSNLIDDWVRRFSTSRPSSAGPLLAALVKADKKNESCRPVTGASIQTSVAPGNPATPCSSSSVAATSGSLLTTQSVLSGTNGGGFHSHHHHHNMGGSGGNSTVMSAAAAAQAAASSHLADRRSPRTKVIDRGRMGAGATGQGAGAGGGLGSMPPGVSLMGPGGVSAVAAAFLNSASVHHFGELHLKAEPNNPMSGLFSPQHHKPGSMPLYMQHHAGPPPPHHQLPHSLASFYSHRLHQASAGGGGGGRESPEQSEAIPLVVTPKKKRHKVTDTRITPRTVSRILGHQEALMESASGGGGGGGSGKYMMGGGGGTSPADVGYAHHQQQHHSHHHPHPPPPMVPVSLPTSVAIPNPGLHQSDVFSPYPYFHPSHQPRASPGSDGMDEAASLFHPSHPHHQALHSTLLLGQSSPDPVHLSSGGRDGGRSNALKAENGGDSSDCNSGDLMYSNDGTLPTSSTLTPMHLRKAKLMFFFVRYPSSAILKTYFPDIQFNKNNTAQLVKWFSNFREFYYIQMEKYARQAISEGCKNAEDITVTVDSELYRVINLHYNRNNHIEVPTNFRFVVEQTLREFFKAVSAGKDSEQSWKKSIYKVIARLDDNLPDYFKSPNFLEQLE